MAYLYNIPQSTDQLSISQGQILGNFTALGAIAGNASTNSSSLNATVGFDYVNLARQNPITPTTGATQMFLFSEDDANSGRQELWIQRPNNGAYISLTGYKNNNAGATAGWTYLPSGMKMVWGTSTITAPGTLTVTYATAVPTFPGFTTFWGAPQLTRVSSGSTVTNFVFLKGFTQTTLTVNTNAVISGTADVAWMAIGL